MNRDREHFSSAAGSRIIGRAHKGSARERSQHRNGHGSTDPHFSGSCGYASTSGESY
jgi:hypothetical protein